ncbi:MAG: histidinol-phosphate transaminase [Clostridiales Family XIII bacterium]|jgi:histidinol-phosphate aminotransferase|nr:histidinol-phosphate transaminase [Clostridiales Family XIII bacterium]
MNNWRENLIHIEPYVAGEQKRVQGLIKLNTNENPFPPSPAVTDALRAYDTADFARYPDPGVKRLARVIAEQTGIPEDGIFVGNGSDEVLAFAFRAFFNSGKPVLFPDITYSFYPVWCRLFGIPYEEIPLDGDFRIRARDYGRENGGVVIANPNAPTGIAEEEAFFEHLLASNPASVVIVDEAYVRFGAHSVLPLLKKYENLFVARTFSKSMSMAGLRLGLGFGSPALISAIGSVKDSFNSYTVSSLQARVGAAAVADEAYYRAQTEKLLQTRDWFAASMRGLGFTVLESCANFVFVTHPEIPAEPLYVWLKERNILVRWFGKPRINNHLRITIGLDEEMEALLSALKEYKDMQREIR